MANLCFSIVIPTYARPAQLNSCLDSLTRLAYPAADFEVIVVDDGSPQRLDATVDLFRPKLQITLLRQSNSGPARARNLGAAKASGRFIAFTDDDCAVDPNWLTAFGQALTANPSLLVGGTTFNAVTENSYAATTQLLVDFLYAHSTSSSGQPRFFASNNIAVSAENFLQLRGFDDSFPLAAGEDREFCHRWQHSGKAIQLVPEAIIHHSHNLRLTTFFRQHTHYGRGAFHFHRKLSSAQSVRRIERFSFYLRLIFYPFELREHTLLKRTQLFCLMVITQVATAVGYVQARSTSPNYKDSYESIGRLDSPDNPLGLRTHTEVDTQSSKANDS